MVYLSGADLGGPTRLGPPISTCKNYSESYIYHYDNMYSSYIDLDCLLCVYVTVKIQFCNTGTHEYLPSARSLRSITRLDLPLYMSSLFKFFVSSLGYYKIYTLLSI